MAKWSVWWMVDERTLQYQLRKQGGHPAWFLAWKSHLIFFLEEVSWENKKKGPHPSAEANGGKSKLWIFQMHGRGKTSTGAKGPVWVNSMVSQSLYVSFWHPAVPHWRSLFVCPFPLLSHHQNLRGPPVRGHTLLMTKRKSRSVASLRQWRWHTKTLCWLLSLDL